MLPSKPSKSEWIQVAAGLLSAIVGVVGANVLRILDYPNTWLLVVFILVWVSSWIYLTTLYWKLFTKLAKPSWVAILTLASPVITSVLLFLWAWQASSESASA